MSLASEIDVFKWDVLNQAIKSNVFKTATPFPHIVIDGAFVCHALERILLDWPIMADNVEEHNDGLYVKKKYSTTWETSLTPPISFFLNQLTSPKFLTYLEDLTGIGGLIPDPYNYGGGLHQTNIGGKLAVHADYNKHFKFKLDRRLNLLIYLNKDWGNLMGGELELWDHGMTECVKRIKPIFNRTVVFTTTSFSFHGQPNPVACPQGESRKSIALYYFSNGRPEEGVANVLEHSTVWMQRPNEGY